MGKIDVKVVRENDIKRYVDVMFKIEVEIDGMLVGMMDGVGRECKVWESEEFKKEFSRLEDRMRWVKEIVDNGERGMEKNIEEWDSYEIDEEWGDDESGEYEDPETGEVIVR